MSDRPQQAGSGQGNGPGLRLSGDATRGAARQQAGPLATFLTAGGELGGSGNCDLLPLPGNILDLPYGYVRARGSLLPAAVVMQPAYLFARHHPPLAGLTHGRKS